MKVEEPSAASEHSSRAMAGSLLGSLGLAAYKLIRVAGLVLAVVSVASYLAQWHKLFDLAAQLRLQLLIGATICLAFTLGRRHWRWSVIVMLGVVLNFWPVAQWYWPKRPPVSTERRLKLVQYNVLYFSRRYQAVMDFVREEQPDIVTLQEITSDWVQGLAPLAKEFADVRIEAGNRGNGIAVYSRIKLDQSETLTLSSDQRPSLLVKFPWAGRQVSLLATHPQNPFGTNRFEWRNEQLGNTAKLLNSLPAPKILIGDLNITMWSPYYQRLEAEAQLVNARAGHGVLPTWNANFRLPFLMIPIDHCLISRDVEVATIRTARNLGSDHLPLVVELVLPLEK